MIKNQFWMGFLTCLGVWFLKAVIPGFTRKLKCITRNSFKTSESVFEQCQGETMRFLVVGRSKSGKKLTIKSFIHKENTETDFLATDLATARNGNTFGWNIYALLSRILNACELHITDQPVKDILKIIMKYKIHVIIYCFTFHEGFTNNDKAIIDRLFLASRSRRIKNSIILLMTHGDIFEERKLQLGFNHFNQWLKEMDPCDLKSVLEKCDNRCVMFQNNAELADIKRQQAIDLFSMAENVVWNNGRIVFDDINLDSHEVAIKETFTNDVRCLTLAYNNVHNQRRSWEISNDTQEIAQFGFMKGLQALSGLLGCFWRSTDRNPETIGDKKFETIRSFYCKFKSDIRAEDFTDFMFQEGILSVEEKQDIDQMPHSAKRKEALFLKIYYSRENRSVDIFLKVLKEIYPAIYNSWNEKYGIYYESLTAAEGTDQGTRLAVE